MPPDPQASGSSPQRPRAPGVASPGAEAPTSTRLEEAIGRLARRSLLGAFLGQALRWIAGGSLVLGAGVLLLRTVVSTGPSPGWAYAPPVLLGIALGLRGARRRALTRAGAATWVDVQAGGSGLIVTGFETGDRRWNAAFDAALGRRVQLPELRIGYPLKLALGGLAFLTLALFVRIPKPTPGPSPEFVRALTATVTDKFEALTANVQLGEALLEELGTRLERLTELAEDAPTESLFEALDRLSERFDAEGARSATFAEEALDSLAAGLASGDLSSPLARSALDAALALLKDGGLEAELPAALAGLLGEDLTLPPGLELDAERWREIAGGLAGHLEGAVGELARAGLVELAQDGLAARLSQFGELLGGDGGALGLLGSLGFGTSHGEGEGGRGGGPAEFTWGTESDARSLEFESAVLSPAEFLDAEHSGVVGHATRRPHPGAELGEVQPEEESAGLVEVQASAGRTAWSRRLAPRHRNAVKKFFGPAPPGAAQRSSQAPPVRQAPPGNSSMARETREKDGRR